MTETSDPVETPTHQDPRPAWRRTVTAIFRELWVTTFRDPVREGHLRLSSLSPLEGHVARAGLVLLGLLLVSMLFATRWREGELTSLGLVDSLTFLPIGALPVTLVAFTLAWTLVLWGALNASVLVRLVTAVVFALSVGSLDAEAALQGAPGSSFVVEHGRALVHTGFLLVLGTLVLSALLVWWRKAAKPLLWVFRITAVTGASLMFLTVLWVHVESVDSGTQSLVPFLLHTSVGQLDNFLFPLGYISVLAIIDFARDVSTSVTTPLQSLTARFTRVLVLVVVLAKLGYEIGLRPDYWVSALVDQPYAFARTTASVVLLVVLVGLSTRFPRSEDFTSAKERLTYGGSVVATIPFLLITFGTGLSLVSLGTFDSDLGSEVNDVVTNVLVGRWAPLVLGAAAVALGIRLMRRSAGGYGDELGSGLIVIGGWNVAFGIHIVSNLQLGFHYPLMDVLVTIGVLGVLLVRWRTIDATHAAILLAVVLFSWLVMSRGDYIAIFGGLFGLPGILVVVFGVVFTLASGSAFTASSSARLPASSRPLLFVGYVLLSVVILHWVQVTHGESSDGVLLTGFITLGIPMAAWLVGRRILQPPVDAPADTAVEDGPGGPPQSDATLRDPISTTPSSTLTS